MDLLQAQRSEYPCPRRADRRGTVVLSTPQYIENSRYPFLPKRGYAMKALILKAFGGPESFELHEVPKPVPQAGQVLVRVHSTSTNPLDYQVRLGDYPHLLPLPAITS
ncbi:NADPH:quinone oxidoreductase, partial [Pseudomonas aeruginosa]